MMGIQDDFKPTRASLLTRSLAPSLDTALKELIFEENPRPTHHISYSDRVLAIPSSPLQQPIDTFTAPPWTNSGRSIPLSPQRVLAASSIMPRAMIFLSTKNFRNSFKSKINVIFLGQPLYVPQIHMCLQVHLRLPHLQVIAVDIEVVFRQVLFRTSTTLSVTSDKHSWLFDTACCNHMASNESQFTDKALLAHPISINIVYGTPILISHKQTKSFPIFSLRGTYHISKLLLNLLYVVNFLNQEQMFYLLIMVCKCRIPRQIRCLGQATRLDV